MIIIFPLQYICIHTNNNKNGIYLFSDINTVILLQYLYMHIYTYIYKQRTTKQDIPIQGCLYNNLPTTMYIYIYTKRKKGYSYSVMLIQ